MDEARLEDVDWSVVISPGTARGHGPELVLDLWRPEVAEAARRTLRQVCALGEYLYPAAAELLPVLVAAAADPAVTVRARLVETVGEIAATAARAEAEGKVARLPATAYLRTGPQPSPAARARTRRMARDWSHVWDDAVTGLAALLDDPSPEVRRSTATALAQATGRADEITALLQRRCETEKDAAAADRLVDSIGRLAAHTNRPEEAVAWLRARLTRDGDETNPDVRVAAVRALRHVLPDHDDPAYARAVTEALQSHDRPPGDRDLFDLDASEFCAVDALLGGDLPGRLALTRTLLHHDEPWRRTGGLQTAAVLMADRRSAVPALLPDVAALTDDPLPDNRALALRLLAMCGTTARPWADTAAAHLTPDDEPDPNVRTQALWALCKMEDDRGVPVLAERMAATPNREKRDGFRDWRPESNQGRWRDLEPNFCEMLAPFAAHHDVLLPALMVKMAARHDRTHYPRVLARWHRDGAPVVPALVDLLDTENALWAAHALAAIDPGPAAAGEADRLRRELPSAPSNRAPLLLRTLWRITGDPGEVVPALLALSTPYLRRGSENATALMTLTEMATADPSVAAQVSDHLRNALRDPAWLGHERTLSIARVLWRTNKRPDEVAPALTSLVERLAEPAARLSLFFTRLESLALLAEVASADPAAIAPALPTLTALADTDERPLTHRHWRVPVRRHWRSVEADDTLRAAVQKVLDAVRPEGAPG